MKLVPPFVTAVAAGYGWVRQYPERIGGQGGSRPGMVVSGEAVAVWHGKAG